MQSPCHSPAHKRLMLCSAVIASREKVPRNHGKRPFAKADMTYLMSSSKIHNERTTGMPARRAWSPEIRASKRKEDSEFPGLKQETNELGFCPVFCFHV